MLKLRVLDLFFTEINVFVVTQRANYRKKVPLCTGTEFQIPIPRVGYRFLFVFDTGAKSILLKRCLNGA